MAAWSTTRNGQHLTDLVHHADHGSNYLSLVYTERISELGITPSTGTIGDSYDNALAEAVNGLFKTELNRRRGPWKTVEQLEMHTPAEIEDIYYADQQALCETTVSQTTG